MDKQHRILAVDDGPINISILEDLLEDYEVSTATHGEEAISMAHQVKPDLILLDIMMPGMTGYEVCRHLRQDKSLCDTKIILVSAKARIEERLQGYEVGADDYVVKPFDCTELLAKVKVYLRLKSMEKIDRLKSSMLKLIGHELRTPLTGMISGLEILADECPTDTAERQEIAHLVLRNIHRLHHLVERAMRLCQIEAGERSWNPQDVDMQDLVLTAIANQSDVAAEKQVILKPQGDQAAMVHVDPKAIQGEILEALLNNAIRFSSDRGEVTITTQLNDEVVTVTVSDQGQGISMDQQTQLFMGFNDCDITHHTRGTGLSLAIAQRIAQQQGGTLAVHSDSGQGASFVLALPLAHASSQTAESNISEVCASQDSSTD